MQEEEEGEPTETATQAKAVVKTVPDPKAGEDATNGEEKEKEAHDEKVEEELEGDATESAADTPAVTTPSCVSSLLHVYA